MLSLFRTIARHDAWRDEAGSTAIEYAVIASLIAVAGVTAFRLVGNRIQSTLSNVAHSLG